MSDFWDTPIEESHQFEVDLNTVVVVNHDFTMESIDRDEEKEISKLEKSLVGKDHEVVRSFTDPLAKFYEDLRKAARNMAMVAVVTRFGHWVQGYEAAIPAQHRNQVKDRSRLIGQLRDLNKYLGVGPVPVEFFAALVDVRDSVIHADSRAQWERKNGDLRQVEKRYVKENGDELDLSEDELREAVEKTKAQIIWYDERLHAMRKEPSQP
jgi:hypothetical protein